MNTHKKLIELADVLAILGRASDAYVSTMQNFVVSGDTMAERRFSQGECSEAAEVAAFEVLFTELKPEHLHAARATMEEKQ